MSQRKPLLFLTLIVAIVALLSTTQANAGVPCTADELNASTCFEDRGYVVRVDRNYDAVGDETTFTYTIGCDPSGHVIKEILALIPVCPEINVLEATPNGYVIPEGQGDKCCSGFGSGVAKTTTIMWDDFNAHTGTAVMRLSGEVFGAPNALMLRRRTCSSKLGVKYYWAYGQIQLPACEVAPAGGSTYYECVNWYGDPLKADDDISLDVTRRGDREGCIKSLRMCVGTGCTDNCLVIDPSDLPEEYVSSGALRGNTCANEVVNVRSGSPFYLYEVVSGGYVWRGCLDLATYQWTPTLAPCGL